MPCYSSGTHQPLYILNQNHPGYLSSKDQTRQGHLLRPDHWFWLWIIKNRNAESALFTLSCYMDFLSQILPYIVPNNFFCLYLFQTVFIPDNCVSNFANQYSLQFLSDPCPIALFDISIWHIDCRYIDTFEKYRYQYQYRYGHFGKYRYWYR